MPTASTQYAIQKALEDTIALVASCNPDILYWDQVMKAHNRDKFIEAVGIELDSHEKMGNYKPIPIRNVPKGTKLIDMVWSMEHKRRIITQEVYKWKARLNVHGGQQEHGVHYWDTYTPVVTWQTVRISLILSILLGWHSRQLDFVMAYPPVPAEMPLYMRLPQGYQRLRMTRKTHALKLICNVYGQKQAGRVWNKFMDKGMRDIGFTPSKFDPCLYYHGPVLFLVYIDDCIVFGQDTRAIDEVVMDLRSCSQQFTVDDQGDVGDFLGIQIQKQADGSVHLLQPQLIDSIIKDLHLQLGSNSKSTPVVTTTLLHKDADGPDMQPEFHYHSVMGKLNFLEKSTRPDISVSIHHCARFSESPKKSHAEAVKRKGRYLLATRDKGLMIYPNKDWHFDCWVDADFAANLRHADAHIDLMMSKSWSGWIVRFAGAPITWALKMKNDYRHVHHRGRVHSAVHQPKGGHSLNGAPHGSTEQGLHVSDLPPRIHCTVFEDNRRAMELARLPNIRPRTKHINQSYHHFREHVERKDIIVEATPTEKQMADILNKPLAEPVFTWHRKAIMRW